MQHDADQQHDEERRVRRQRARARRARSSSPRASRRSRAPARSASSARTASRSRARCCRRACWPRARRTRCRCCCPPRRTRTGSRRSRARPGLATPALPGSTSTAMAVPTEHHERRQQDRDRGHLHLERLDLLAEILGRAADHEPGDEHRDDREHDHAVEPRADAAEDHLAELHEPHRHQPAERRERVVHRVDRAVRRGGRRRRPQRRVGDAEARFLAFHVAAGLESARACCRRRPARAAGLPACSDADATASRPTKTIVIAARIAQPWRMSPTMRPNVMQQRRGDQQDREQLEEVRERRRVLERMRRVHVEEAAAVGAELLDRDLRGRRADRQRPAPAWTSSP